MKKIKARLSLFLVFILFLTACTPSAQEESDLSFTPGTYETETDGYGGPIKVSTTFSENAIDSVEILSHGETDGIGTNAIDQLPEAIVKNQSLGLDTVTGATISSEAILAAVEKAVTEAGGNVEALKAASVEANEDAEPVNKETDVVVVGGGGAGLSAAVAAADNGAKVILVEKTGALGGNTIRAGGPYNAVDPDRQANVEPADKASMDKVKALTEKETKSPRHQELMDELKKDIEAYEAGAQDHLFDSLALHKLQTYDGGDYQGELDKIEKLVEESLDTSEWMASNGVEWTDSITTVAGGLWPRAHIPAGSAGGDYIKAGEARAKDLGVEILLNSPAEELIVEDGTVVGIKGTSNGAPMEIRSKFVILASGGFAANKEMRKEFVPELNDELPTTNSPAITGDGLKMAEAVDADLRGMGYIQSLPLGSPEDGGLNAWMGGPGVEYYYQVNKEGKRFMAEDGRRDVMTSALIAQTDSMSYVITAANNTLEIGDGITENIWGDNIEALVEEGKIFRADTIEELAEQIDIDPAVLAETHAKFNEAVANGNDEEFGRSLFGAPVDGAPYYASPRVPTVHHTMGGLGIDLEARVLNKEGNVIPGLLAAGEVTGGIHGSNRLGGNALVDIHVFGRTAGETAARLIEDAQ
ncbi:flavocytochrome c [Peptoniphilus sp. KCTC 25270]|uniref:flavocytochrome c n=1 Tax=Peptoniphilus sp. KCTC 25270 TaxID=2897414 RepID=UPI001E2BD3A2|nr:flavocytochrome c [Peptoniphilus sp. KCTC 25270]MCD1147206.1 flavocytochrome c [Peptoniphilus sp. KCTC 25270]